MHTPFPPKTTFAALIHPGLVAIRRLWVPFLLIQFCGLVVVLSYFNSEHFRTFCDRLAELKQAGGYAFAALTLGVACGIGPEVFKFISGIDRTFTRERACNTAFNFFLFALIGIWADAFYRSLAYLLGPSDSVKIVAMKVAADQFLYSPTLGTVFIAVAYTWREHRYRLIPTIRSMGGAWYLSRALPMLLPSWCYWIPMACLMYSLPPSLTFVFNALAGAASAMLLVSVAERKVVRQLIHPSSDRETIAAQRSAPASGFTPINAVD